MNWREGTYKCVCSLAPVISQPSDEWKKAALIAALEAVVPHRGLVHAAAAWVPETINAPLSMNYSVRKGEGSQPTPFKKLAELLLP